MVASHGTAVCELYLYDHLSVQLHCPCRSRSPICSI